MIAHDPRPIYDALAKLVKALEPLAAFEPRMQADLAAIAGQIHAGAGLPERQREILLLRAAGLDGREIAARLGLAENSVRNHLVKLYERLGARGVAHALTKALVDGYITVADLEAADREVMF